MLFYRHKEKIKSNSIFFKKNCHMAKFYWPISWDALHPGSTQVFFSCFKYQLSPLILPDNLIWWEHQMLQNCNYHYSLGSMASRWTSFPISLFFSFGQNFSYNTSPKRSIPIISHYGPKHLLHVNFLIFFVLFLTNFPILLSNFLS